MFVANLLLALTWIAMSGEFGATNFAIGFALGYLVLLVTRRSTGPSSYFGRTWCFVRFVGFYLREVWLANLRVAYDVITPTHHMRPSIVAVPLDVRSDAEITLLANLLTMTPGTLSMDVSDDRTTLYVHSMFVDDPEAFRRGIKDGFERRVIELLR